MLRKQIKNETKNWWKRFNSSIIIYEDFWLFSRLKGICAAECVKLDLTAQFSASFPILISFTSIIRFWWDILRIRGMWMHMLYGWMSIELKTDRVLHCIYIQWNAIIIVRIYWEILVVLSHSIPFTKIATKNFSERNKNLPFIRMAC